MANICEIQPIGFSNPGLIAFCYIFKDFEQYYTRIQYRPRNGQTDRLTYFKILKSHKNA